MRDLPPSCFHKLQYGNQSFTENSAGHRAQTTDQLLAEELLAEERSQTWKKHSDNGDEEELCSGLWLGIEKD